MVLRHLLEKRDARKEREDELAAELAPYEGYLHQEFERMLAEEREILEPTPGEWTASGNNACHGTLEVANQIAKRH